MLCLRKQTVRTVHCEIWFKAYSKAQTQSSVKNKSPAQSQISYYILLLQYVFPSICSRSAKPSLSQLSLSKNTDRLYIYNHPFTFHWAVLTVITHHCFDYSQHWKFRSGSSLTSNEKCWMRNYLLVENQSPSVLRYGCCYWCRLMGTPVLNTQNTQNTQKAEYCKVQQYFGKQMVQKGLSAPGIPSLMLARPLLVLGVRTRKSGSNSKFSGPPRRRQHFDAKTIWWPKCAAKE